MNQDQICPHQCALVTVAQAVTAMAAPARERQRKIDDYEETH